MLLQNKIAVITGSNRGIGYSILENFLKNGANIIACVRNIKSSEKKLKSLANVYNRTINIVSLDLENEKSIKEAVKEIFKITKKVDVLVNNAGIANGALFQMTQKETLLKTFEINFFHQILFSQSIAKIMIRNSFGSIINISSVTSTIPDEGTLCYGSSKAALKRASMSMAKELGKFNIRVNTLSPGVVKTDMYDLMSDNSRNKLINSSIFGRAANPIEVSNVALFLASDLSSFITGQDICVNGGII